MMGKFSKFVWKRFKATREDWCGFIATLLIIASIITRDPQIITLTSSMIGWLFGERAVKKYSKKPSKTP